MPDGSAFPPTMNEAAPQSTRAPYSSAADFAYFKALLPATPLSYRLAASALAAIERQQIGNGRLGDLEDNLNDAAVDLPVTKLEDAMALVTLLPHMVEMFEGFNLTPDVIEQQIGIMRRVLEAALPMLSAASSFDLATFGCETFRASDRERVVRAGYLPVLVKA